MSVIKSYWHSNILSLWYKLLLCCQLGASQDSSQNHLPALTELRGLPSQPPSSPSGLLLSRDRLKAEGREGQSTKLLHHTLITAQLQQQTMF